MTKKLDLADIQGNVVRGYGRFGFPVARYFFLRVDNPLRGRRFIGAVTERVTTSVTWGEKGAIPKPESTTNIGFTFKGLMALEIPAASLIGFPEEFMMGMKRRRDILGDDGPSAPEHWDPIWNEEIHIWMSVNGETEKAVEERYAWIKGLIDQSDGGVVLLAGHRGEGGREDLLYQDAALLKDAEGNLRSSEHFGYADGIGDPVFEGQPGAEARVKGRGKLNRDGSWSPLATGEFILGHPDEAEEYPPAHMPVAFARNGTFMVYRKLHENVASFNKFLAEKAKTYPGGDEELLAAKFGGRWRDNGLPLVKAPDAASKALLDEKIAVLKGRMAKDPDSNDAKAAKRELDELLADFTYNDDLDGAKCPVSAHLRRINPRGSLEFGQKGAFARPGALVDRRRLMRRGLPYGEVKDPARDDGNHGIIFMAMNASIQRQFEFVQQQWINYGNDFKEGNDKDVILGNHDACCPGKVVIRSDPKTGKPPYFVDKIPRLVETRGGEYFFIPGMTALRMIAAGSVDPT